VSTDVSHRPGPMATRSIYTYSVDQPNDTREAGQEGTLITSATPAAAAGAVSDQVVCIACVRAVCFTCVCVVCLACVCLVLYVCVCCELYVCVCFTCVCAVCLM